MESQKLELQRRQLIRVFVKRVYWLYSIKNSALPQDGMFLNLLSVIFNMEMLEGGGIYFLYKRLVVRTQAQEVLVEACFGTEKYL